MKILVAMFMAVSMAACGGVAGDDEGADPTETGEDPEESIPIEPGGDGEPDVTLSVCGLDRFDADSGELLYRDVRSYFDDGERMVMDRDIDGDGVVDDQYHYRYRNEVLVAVQFDRGVDGAMDYLREHVMGEDNLSDYYLQNDGELIDGVWRLKLDWDWVVDNHYNEDGRITQRVHDDTADLDFSDQETDYNYYYIYDRDEQDRAISISRFKQTLGGINWREDRVWDESDFWIERHFSNGQGGLIDENTPINRSEYRLFDEEGRVEQKQHDRDGDGDIDWIERLVYEGCGL